MPLTVFLSACGPDAGPDTAHSYEAAPPLPTVGGSALTAELSAQEVATALTGVLAGLPDPAHLVEAYAELRAHGDAECPGEGMNLTGAVLHGCTSNAGYRYAGVAEYISGPMDMGALLGDARVVYGDFEITRPDGAVFEAGGHVVVVTAEDFAASELAGTWRWEGGEPWAAVGTSGSLRTEAAAGHHVSVDGAIDMEGTYVAAAGFGLNAACGWGPSGMLQLRDPSGGWHSLRFESCAPCAEVVFEGQALGQGCPDFAGLRARLEGRIP